MATAEEQKYICTILNSLRKWVDRVLEHAALDAEESADRVKAVLLNGGSVEGGGDVKDVKLVRTLVLSLDRVLCHGLRDEFLGPTVCLWDLVKKLPRSLPK